MGSGASSRSPSFSEPTGNNRGGDSRPSSEGGQQVAGKRKGSLSALIGLPAGIAPPGVPGQSGGGGGDRANMRRGSGAQHVQEEAASFRSKSSSIKMMMRNQTYRKSFFKFLETSHKGKEELMDYFLAIETLRKVKEKDVKRAQFMEHHDAYEKKSAGKGDDTPESIIFRSMHHWKGVANLTDEELYKHVERSQDDILLALTPLFETFLESPYFAEVKQAEAREEKRRFSVTST